MFIEQPPWLMRALLSHADWRESEGERCVYLTFDDGPIPEVTPWVLDVLKKYGVKATFFMVGDNVRKHPDVFEQVVQEGHAVGNHTFSHWSGFRHSNKDYLNDVERADRLIGSHLFRPPYGWMRFTQYNTLRRKYRIVMWDVVTRDYSTHLNAREVLQNVCRYARPGSIITFHDSLKSISKLRTALPEAIEWLLEQGYEFRTFS